MPPEPEDFDSYAKRFGWSAEPDAGGGDDEFGATAARMGWKPEEEAPPPSEPGTGSGWQDFLVGLVEGAPAALGGMRAFGGVGGAVLSRSGPTKQVFDEHDKNAALATQTNAGKLGQAVGGAATSLALGGAAGGGVPAQAVAGALTSAGEAANESGGDPWSVLTALPTGAAFGAGGALLGKAANAVANNADEILRQLPAPSIRNVVRHPLESALTTAARAAAQSPRTMNALASTARGAGALGAASSGTLEGMIGKAQAQDDKAYGTAPTMAWAVQSVLAGGDTGLARADEQRLAEAIESGDEDRVISANFTLQQKSPAYAARLQRELASLQEE